MQGPSAGIPHGYNVCNRVHCMHTMYANGILECTQMYATGMHTMYAIGYTVCTLCMQHGYNGCSKTQAA